MQIWGEGRSSSKYEFVTVFGLVLFLCSYANVQLLIPVDVRPSATTANPVKKILPEAGELSSAAVPTSDLPAAAAGKTTSVTNKPKRTGSIALFFRKVSNHLFVYV